MNRQLLAFLPVFVASAASAALSVSNVTITQQPNRAVVVSYDLAADAIITADILTNGVSIGAQCFHTLSGDINARVAAGTGRAFTWKVRRDWPDQKREVTVRLTAHLPDALPDYVVCDLVNGGRTYYASADDIPGTVTNDVYKTDKLVFRRIPAAGAEYRMGQRIGELCEGKTSFMTVDYCADSETPHLVAFTSDFYMTVFEVTQRQYWHLTGKRPSEHGIGTSADNYNGSRNYPVDKVSYDSLRGTPDGTFLGWPGSGHEVAPTSVLATLRDKLGILSLDLPTEAQWEFACRAGTTTSLNSGWDLKHPQFNNKDQFLDELGWYGNDYGNASKWPHEVGLKKPNAWGLYDMHGNIYEMCLDWLSTGDAYRSTFAAGWQSGAPTVDPVGSASGVNRVLRGGDYFYAATYSRSGCRAGITSDPSVASAHYGLRLVCSGSLD